MLSYNVTPEGKAVLVTGAASFIGANLSKRLLLSVKNIRIIGIDSVNDYYDVRIKENRLKEIEALAKDRVFVRDKALVEETFAKYQPAVVVNLAAQAGVRYSITNPDAYIASNIIGFYNKRGLEKVCRMVCNLYVANYKINKRRNKKTNNRYGKNNIIKYRSSVDFRKSTIKNISN